MTGRLTPRYGGPHTGVRCVRLNTYAIRRPKQTASEDFDMTAEPVTSPPSIEVVTSLSDAIFGPIRKAYRLGGFALAFLGVGVLMMLVVFLSDRTDWRGKLLFAIGVLLVLATGVLFLLKDVLPLLRAQQRIAEHREFIDAVQQTAILLTTVLDAAQELAVENAERVTEAFERLRPLVRALPAIGGVADSKPVATTAATARQIVEIATKSRNIIADVREALVHSDPQPLRQFASDLAEVSARLKEATANS